MIKFFQWVYTAYAALLFFALMLVFGLFIFLPLTLHPRGDKVAFVFIRLWVGIWSACVGIRYEVHGLAHIDLSQSYIFIFNHRSNLDAPLIPMVVPHRVRAIGKKELANIPIFGTVVDKLAVWVDRSDPESRKRSLERLVDLLQQGISVVVSPEGTRNNSSETLLPFHKGAFRLSIDTQIPLVSMAIFGADKLMKRGSLLLKPGKIKVYFSAPKYPPAPSPDAVEKFTQKCRANLEAMLLTLN